MTTSRYTGCTGPRRTGVRLSVGLSVGYRIMVKDYAGLLVGYVGFSSFLHNNISHPQSSPC